MKFDQTINLTWYYIFMTKGIMTSVIFLRFKNMDIDKGNINLSCTCFCTVLQVTYTVRYYII